MYARADRGATLWSSDAVVRRSVIRSSWSTASQQPGDGISAATGKVVKGRMVDFARASKLHVSDSLVELSKRAGLYFRASNGALRRSVVRSSAFPVCLEDGASPIIGTDNLFVGNQDNRISVGLGLAPAAPLLPPPPM